MKWSRIMFECISHGGAVPMYEWAGKAGSGKGGEAAVNNMHYWGLDVHKKTISDCLRQADGSMGGRRDDRGDAGGINEFAARLAATVERWLGSDDVQRLDLRSHSRASGLG